MDGQSSAPAPFRYSPLLGGAQEIRLVRLLDGADIIRLEMRHFQMSALPAYTALSYRWGMPARDCPVEVNGCSLGVTASLLHFLFEGRNRRGDKDVIPQNSPWEGHDSGFDTAKSDPGSLSKAKDLFSKAVERRMHEREANAVLNPITPEASSWQFGWLWIDAICVNQEDLKERSEQVGLMRDIYEQADCLLIWLGQAKPDTQRAFNLLEQIVDIVPGDRIKRFSMEVGSVPGESFLLGHDGHYFETDAQTLVSLKTVLVNDYWSRVWIIQEASTPKDLESGLHAVVCSGGFSIARRTLFEANRRLRRAHLENEALQYFDLLGVQGHDLSQVCHAEHRRRSSKAELELYQILQKTRLFHATDPRDKLYGVLGMVDKRVAEIKALPSSDYETNVSTLWINLARTLIGVNNSLDYLGSAGLIRSSGVPSWVPDWSIGLNAVPLPFWLKETAFKDNSKTSQEMFSACRKLPAKITFDETQSRLLATGFVFDHITATSYPRNVREPRSFSTRMWTDWTTVVLADDSDYVSGGTRYEAFIRTLHADHFKGQEMGTVVVKRGISMEGYRSTESNAFETEKEMMIGLTRDRSVVVTAKGYIGMTAGDVTAGDVVCILFGSQMPLVLRKNVPEDCWLLVGQAYVHGIMDGEALDLVDLAAVKQTFEVG